MNKYLEQLLDIEVIAKSEPASMLHENNKRCNGRLILSGKRILFICNGNENPEIDIDLDTINSLTHESQFVDHNILAIHYLQYELARFTVIDYDSWETAIEQQRMKPHVKPQFSIYDLN
ncbi:MAG: hypothetical protein JST82_05635 [Bacteroidetes bacterium]|nr:hypothetical protein [Bacteroidota bacterium]